MPAGVAAASPMVAGARTPTVASDSPAAAAGRFHGIQTSKTETSSNPYFLLPVLVICTICTHSTCARIKGPGAYRTSRTAAHMIDGIRCSEACDKSDDYGPKTPVTND
jgi:hypothetical protein